MTISWRKAHFMKVDSHKAKSETANEPARISDPAYAQPEHGHKYEYSFTIVSKLSSWAESLPDDIDFIDYWHTLALSKTKADSDSDIMHRINAFYWTIWQENFEEYVDGYTAIPGEGYDADNRSFFGRYMQYLVYAFQLPSRAIAEFYGKDVYRKIMLGMPRYHTMGADAFVENIVEKYGVPPGVANIEQIGA